MDNLLQDVRYALRMLRRTPGFTAAAVLTLALGIGANTAMFSVVHGVLLRPLPYPQPEALARLAGRASAPDLRDLAMHARSFEGFAGYRASHFDVPGEPLAERLDAAVVTGAVFPLLGVPAAQGRTLEPGDDVAGGEKVLLVTDEFWRQRLGADPAAVGATVQFVSGTYRVVGIMPPGFQLPQVKAQAFAPFLVESAAEAQARGAHSLLSFARLRPGVSMAQAQAELDALRPVMERIDPVENRDRRYPIAPLHAYLVRDVRAALLLLFGAVGFVLLIATVNVVNLLIARAGERQREMAIRASLGATRGRLLRQLMAESMLLALAGGLAGVAVAVWALDLTIALGADKVPALESVRLDTRVLAYTAAVSLAAGLLFGLAPGLQGSAAQAAGHLKDARAATAGRDRLRRALVGAEVALAVVLLAGAGLLLRSLHSLRSVDPGFRTDGLLTFNLTLPLEKYRDIPRRTTVTETLIEQLAAQPGVTDVAATTELPFTSDRVPQNFVVEGAPEVAAGSEPEVNSRGVTRGYFRTMGIPLLRGRDFDRTDAAGSVPVGIVNEAAVRQLFGGQDPVGRRVAWAREEPRVWMTVVGVAGDVRGSGLDAEESPALYTPAAQERRFWRTWLFFVARTGVPPHTLVEPIKREVARLDKDVPVTRVRTMDELMAASLGNRRFDVSLLAAFALVALALAAIGVHGVMSYAVARRTREIGVRMALGATAGDVLGLVLRQGATVVGIGLAAGVAGALAVRRVVEGMLYGVPATDPVTFAAVVVILAAVAALACYAPARRAVRVDPAVALRYE